MLLVIDIGNTNVKLATFAYPGPPADPRDVWRTESVERVATEHDAVLRHLLRREGESVLADIAHVAIGSVVPALTESYRRTCGSLFPRASVFVVGPAEPTPLASRYDRVHGVDRIANAVAAFESVGAATIAVDIGTATTFDYVSGAGEYWGGAIVPGPEVAFRALTQRTAQISDTEWVRPPSVIGRSKLHSLQSGMFYGYAAMVDGMIARMEEEAGESVHAIATGGLAHVVVGIAHRIDAVDPYLTLRGIRGIFVHAASGAATPGG